MRMPRRAWRISVSLLYAATLIYFSLTPTSAPTGSTTMVIVKRWLFNLLHVPAYAGLTLLFTWAIAGPVRPRYIGALVLACVLALSVGVTTELLQTYVQGRYPTLLDALLNAAGCAIGVLVITRTRWFGRRPNRSDSCIEETTG